MRYIIETQGDVTEIGLDKLLEVIKLNKSHMVTNMKFKLYKKNIFGKFKLIYPIDYSQNTRKVKE